MGPTYQRNPSNQQQCAICLERLFCSPVSSIADTDTSVPKICAIVPCGHVFHQVCAKKWRSANDRRLAHTRYNNSRESTVQCKCPMCNAPTERFVTLYISSTSGYDDSYDGYEKEEEEEDGDENNNMAKACDSMEKLRANEERIRNKLQRYKRQNRSLKHELKRERQNFYSIIEKQENERTTWSRETLELRRELDETLSFQRKERLEWDIKHKRMQQELHRLKNDCERADYQIQKASDGLAELKVFNKERQSTVKVLLQEKSRLMTENRSLKKTLLSTHGSIRTEYLGKNDW